MNAKNRVKKKIMRRKRVKSYDSSWLLERCFHAINGRFDLAERCLPNPGDQRADQEANHGK